MKKKNMKILIMGLGYVGINLAYSFSKKTNVIGLDINKKVIDDYKKGIDYTNEIGNNKIKKSSIFFTSDESIIKTADVIIVAVPTPIDDLYKPDLKFLYSAADNIIKNIRPGTLIVLESTVSPGTTDELIKYIEEKSSMTVGKDFYVGYSPERINPGDKKNKISNSVKIISANDTTTLSKMYKVYSLILSRKNIYSISDIKVAEATKIIENTQRDVNIAFMNEMNKYLYKKGISSKQVLNAMNTKWNSLGFTHGLVGGHCIGIDPYYLLESDKDNLLSLVKIARNENENFYKYLLDRIVKNINHNQKIGIIGFTYKPNVNDVRNTKVYDLYKELKKLNYNVEISDFLADTKRMKDYYDVDNNKTLKDLDVIILAVPHKKYIDNEDVLLMMFNKNENKKIIIDIYSVLNMNDSEDLKIERI